MKTRVLKGYDRTNAVDVFHVQKWALWDDAELRRYYPAAYDWRHVRTCGNERDACQLAERLANSEGKDELIVVAEFGKDQREDHPQCP